MLRIGPALSCIAEHIQTLITSPEAYRPAKCPHCGLAGLWVHGVYHREAGRDLNCRERIAVPRFICGRKGGCGTSSSVLPSCLPAHRWYGWSVQQAVLVLLLSGASLRECANTGGAVRSPARSTMRRWWQWLQDQHALFSFHLLTTNFEWDRTETWKDFWRLALAHKPLASLMASLDHRGLAVP